MGAATSAAIGSCGAKLSNEHSTGSKRRTGKPVSKTNRMVGPTGVVEHELAAFQSDGLGACGMFLLRTTTPFSMSAVVVAGRSAS